jgi:SHS2 domain-containing protein
VIEPGYEILEHTADIGIHALGPTLVAVFEQAALGLAAILGASADAPRAEVRRVEAEAGDREALLVDFLNELLLLHETEEVALGSVEVRDLSDRHIVADVGVVPVAGETESTGVKAATYHGLEIREIEGGFEARVYLDV